MIVHLMKYPLIGGHGVEHGIGHDNFLAAEGLELKNERTTFFSLIKSRKMFTENAE